MSAYTYGASWRPENPPTPAGWTTNDIPRSTLLSDMIHGQNNQGNFDFYAMFSGGAQPQLTTGTKPFMVTETGATIHIAVLQTTGEWVAPANSLAADRGVY